MIHSVADTADTLHLEAASTTFSYRRFGPTGGVPLVLFMRFRGTIDHWDPLFLDLLAEQRDVIIFDNVGSGHTPGIAPATIGAVADDALAFIDALGLAQVDILGWSHGGAVVQALTLKRPALVRRLIVAGSGPGTVPNLPPTDPRVFEVMANSAATADDQSFLFYPETDGARALAAASDARVARRTSQGASVSDESAGRQFEALSAFFLEGRDNVYDNLTEIKNPVLYANGSHDVMISALGSYAAAQRLPDATLILYSDAGHAFLFQHVERFAAQIKLFLDD